MSMMVRSSAFRLGITRNCIAMGGEPGLFSRSDFAPLDGIEGLAYRFLDEGEPVVTAEHAADYDAIFALQPRIVAGAFGDGPGRLRHLALSGAGFDTVDLDACTRAGILVTNTPDDVARSVATAILTLILALSHKLMIKDGLTRTGRWHERTRFMGQGLTGKVVGSVGFGNIAREMFRLLKPFEMVHIATSPRGDPLRAAAEGVALVNFATLFAESDYVCVNCPLTQETRRLVDAKALSLMKPGACLINTSRGPVVDERALYEALVSGRLAGAALDVFEEEPTPSDNPLLTLDNVIVTPHSLCWTDECFRGIAKSAIAAIVAVMTEKRPAHLLNPAALSHAHWRDALS